jgi:hypothetical protein
MVAFQTSRIEEPEGTATEEQLKKDKIDLKYEPV